ncbi:outer membrane lipoprotein carrier protein LolA [Kitasatospora hibisci]|uniref:LolA family protein n=1 Tax=Kitasatospora hibisci TaxID=3369522 RepID=UPI0037543620
MTDERPAERHQDDGGAPYRAGRRTAVRVAVPVAVAAVIAAGVGLVPALAADSPPDLPALTAEQLVAKALGSQTQTLSGTVAVSADLGVPSQLLTAGVGVGSRGTGGTGGTGSSAAAPEAKLTALLGGEHTLRVAVDGPDRQRVGLVETLAGYELIHNGDQVWAWDSSTNEAVHLTAPQGAGQDAHGGADRKAPLTGVPATPQEAARRFLTASAGTTAVTVDGTTTVAGQKAYQLSVKPTRSGSTIGEVRIAVAAENGVPLAVLVRDTDGGKVFDLHFTEVSFARPSAKTFDFAVPKGAKVTEHEAGNEPKASSEQEVREAAEGLNVVGEGWTAVLSAKLPTGEVAAPAGGRHGDSGKSAPQSPLALAKSLGKPVKGGSLISTKVLNVLVTDDGRVFAGAVTLPVLQSAAGVK